jgi:hypothetical protein
MKKLVKPLVMLLLLLNGVAAIYGGWQLMDHPDGSSLSLPLQYLSTTPFMDYRLPGILLFSTIGIYSIALFSLILSGTEKYAGLLLAQGIILSIWIIAQLIFQITFSILHALFLLIGLTFIYTGMLELRKNLIP